MARKKGQRARRHRASYPEPYHAYTLRRRDQRASYLEPRDPESESESDSHNSDSDNSMFKPTRPTRRRRTTSSTHRELETERVDSRGDVIARGGQDHGQGGKTRSYSQSAMETEMANSSVDLNARPGQGRGQDGNTRLRTPRTVETKMVDSDRDLTPENPTPCIPRAKETELAASSAGLIARRRRGHGKGDNTTSSISSAAETEMVGSNGDLIAKRKQVHGQCQNRRPSCTLRAKENEMVDSSADSIAKCRQGHGEGGDTTLSSGRAMETEMVDSSVDTNSRHKQVRRRGGKTTLSTPRTMETGIGDSNADLTAENTESCAQKAKETEMVESIVDLDARCRKSHGQGGNSRLGSARGMKADPVDSGVEMTAGNTRSRIPRAMETEMVHSGVDVTPRRARGRRRGQRGHRQGGHSGGRGGGTDTRWGIQGTRSRPAQRGAAEGGQNKESTNLGPSLIMEKGPSSPERQSSSMKRGSPSTKQVWPCKKTILSWLIDCKRIEDGEQVCYMDGTKASATMTGRITRGGILCSCCQREISVWTFEKHAGSDIRQPYQHIYLRKKGLCLQDCQIAAWQDPGEQKRRSMFSYVPKENAADQNDDACSICGDGGELILCDNCPSTYHPSCMNLKGVPHADWLCPYCICKYCGLGGESKEFITCCQCDKKFHWGCFKEFEKEFSKETLDLNCSRLYCGPGCREIYEKLEGSLGIRNDIFANYSWRVVRNMDMSHMTPKVFSAARNLQLENNSKVAVAWMLMNEAFKTMRDRHTGIDVVQSIVYSRGSNLTRVNFSRFYTFVLEKDDEIIAAASIRFHGRGIAEMPFIATDGEYRQQGICKSLMGVIVSFLRGLKVENLIIPSIPETVGMWKSNYSFNDVSKELKREIASFNVLMFPGATRLCKVLSKSIADGGHGVDNEHNQTDIQNGQEPQMEQAERPLLDLNVDLHQEDE